MGLERCRTETVGIANALDVERDDAGARIVREIIDEVGQIPLLYYSYKNLTCPACGQQSKARLVKRVGAATAKGSGRMLK